MIEIIVKEWLEQQLALPVYPGLPAHPPDEFLVTEKTGGGFSNRISKATIIVQSYAPSLLEAARLNGRAKAAMLGMAALNVIGSVKLNTDYNYTDTANKRHRYQAVFDLTYYEDVSALDTGKGTTNG